MSSGDSLRNESCLSDPHWLQMRNILNRDVLKAFVAIALTLSIDELETTPVVTQNLVWLQQFHMHCLQAYSILISAMPHCEIQKEIEFTAVQCITIREMTHEIGRQYRKHCQTIATQTKTPLVRVQMELDIFAVCWENISHCLDFITDMIYQELQSYVEAYQDIPDLSELAIKRMIMTAYFCSALLIRVQSRKELDAEQKLDDDHNSAQIEPMQTEEQIPVKIAVGEEQTSPGEDMNLMERYVLIVRPRQKLTVTDGTSKPSKPLSKP